MLISVPIGLLVYCWIFKLIRNFLRNLLKWNPVIFLKGGWLMISAVFFLVLLYEKWQAYELLYKMVSYSLSWPCRNLRFPCTFASWPTLSVWWFRHSSEWLCYYEYLYLLSWWHVPYFLSLLCLQILITNVNS